MDLQHLLDAMMDSQRHERGRYHLTLGGLIAALRAARSDAPVVFDHGAGVGEENSYRGYYSDLSFTSGAITDAKALLARCERALGEAYEGYKGGDFIMGADTPLWNAAYGCTGLAIIGAATVNGELTLMTKDVD